MLPNSQDGWWNVSISADYGIRKLFAIFIIFSITSLIPPFYTQYKMYNPPLSPDKEDVYTWEYRKSLLKERIGLVDADVVCLQEVSPLSFAEDFSFMTDDLGYDGVELFKKGRFRPATFFKKDRVELTTNAVHKDRTLLTSFRLVDDEDDTSGAWHVLNCHLQAGKQGGRRVRQIVEGVLTAYKTAKNKLKENDPENLKLIVCGDMNGDAECGAIHILKHGSIDETFIEDGEKVSSKAKKLPIPPMIDAMSIGRNEDQQIPATLVVPELISLMMNTNDVETAYTNPKFSDDVRKRLSRIYSQFATVSSGEGADQMGKEDVFRWLEIINKVVGRGTEFRNAAKYMGWIDESKESDENGEEKKVEKRERPPIFIPDDGILTQDDFLAVYLDELKQGKFWGIAWDLAALGEPLPIKDVFKARYDHIYCSTSLVPAVVLDTVSNIACPNEHEPSDHLPVCAAFVQVKERS